MTLIAVVVALLFIVGAALGVYAVIAPRRTELEEEPTVIDRLALPPLQSTPTDWTNEAGDEFSGLSDAARCDLVFAVAAIDDERCARLLEFALNDPSEAVAIAAARALVSSGRGAVVEQFLAKHPGERAEHIANMLALLV